jgi:hypothetical protein
MRVDKVNRALANDLIGNRYTATHCILSAHHAYKYPAPDVLADDQLRVPQMMPRTGRSYHTGKRAVISGCVSVSKSVQGQQTIP